MKKQTARRLTDFPKSQDDEITEMLESLEGDRQFQAVNRGLFKALYKAFKEQYGGYIVSLAISGNIEIVPKVPGDKAPSD